jgi:hypothetical protein
VNAGELAKMSYGARRSLAMVPFVPATNATTSRRPCRVAAGPAEWPGSAYRTDTEEAPVESVGTA